MIQQFKSSIYTHKTLFHMFIKRRQGYVPWHGSEGQKPGNIPNIGNRMSEPWHGQTMECLQSPKHMNYGNNAHQHGQRVVPKSK